MTTKSLLIAGAITLATAGLAAAKSYDIELLHPTMAGATELKPGEYKLKLEGSVATLKDVQTDKTYTLPVRVETSERKFNYTSVESSAGQNGMDTLQSIDLGDTNTRLAVGQ
jgi:hypothetical protein